MSVLGKLLERWPVSWLIRLACWLSLGGLAIMVSGVLFPGPLPVMAGMSVGQVMGLAGLGIYVLAVLTDAARIRARRRGPTPPPASPDSEPPPSARV